VKTLAGILLRALPAGLAALALHGIFGLVHWYTWQSYVVIGLSLSLFGWGGDLLRRTLTDRPAIKIGGSSAIKIGGFNVGPTQLTDKNVGATLSVTGILRALPFWFFSGGCGYTTGMLAAKKLLLLGFYDVPVRPIFLLGGITGCVLQMVYESAKFMKIPGESYDPR
jgi:hypothetical protein